MSDGHFATADAYANPTSNLVQHGIDGNRRRRLEACSHPRA